MVSYESVSSLRKLKKDEIGNVQLTDEMIYELRMLRRRAIIYSGFPLLFICLFMLSFFSKVSFTEMEEVYMCVPFMSVLAFLVFRNVIPIFLLTPSNIKYSGFYKLTYTTHSDSDGSHYHMHYAVDERLMKRLPSVEVIKDLHFRINFTDEYLFVSYNGKRFYFIPVTKPSDYVEEVKPSDYKKPYSISGLYSTNSSCLNDDDYFMFNKFKKSCYSDLYRPLFILTVNFIFFNGFILIVLFQQTHSFTMFLTLICLLLFINTIICVFFIRSLNEYVTNKKYLSEVISLELCEVLKVRGSASGGHVKLSFDLMKADGSIEYGINSKIIKVKHGVSLGDRLFLVSIGNSYFCYPSKEVYDNKIK